MSRKARFAVWCFLFAGIVGMWGGAALLVSMLDEYKTIERVLLMSVFLAVASYGSRVTYALLGLGTAGLSGISLPK